MERLKHFTAAFPGDLLYPEEIPEGIRQSLLEEGFAVEQKLEGVTFIKMTNAYYKELGDYIVKHPRELCRDYWNLIANDTRNSSIMDFIRRFCETHVTIKELTNGKVDFTELIGEEIG